HAERKRIPRGRTAPAEGRDRRAVALRSGVLVHGDAGDSGAASDDCDGSNGGHHPRSAAEQTEHPRVSSPRATDGGGRRWSRTRSPAASWPAANPLTARPFHARPESWVSAWCPPGDGLEESPWPTARSL